MSTELAAPRCQAGSVQPVAVLALQLCSPALQGAGVSLPLAFPGGLCGAWPCPPRAPPLWPLQRRVRCAEAEAALAFSSRETPAPPPASDSLGCISKTVRKSLSEVMVRKPISALG